MDNLSAELQAVSDALGAKIKADNSWTPLYDYTIGEVVRYLREHPDNHMYRTGFPQSECRNDFSFVDDMNLAYLRSIALKPRRTSVNPWLIEEAMIAQMTAINIQKFNEANLDYSLPTLSSFDGGEFSHRNIDMDALTPKPPHPDEVITYRARRYASRLPLIIVGSNASATSQSLAETAQVVPITNSYKFVENSHTELKKVNEPFWKGVKAKGGKKNKKNWR